MPEPRSGRVGYGDTGRRRRFRRRRRDCPLETGNANARDGFLPLRHPRRSRRASSSRSVCVGVLRSQCVAGIIISNRRFDILNRCKRDLPGTSPGVLWRLPGTSGPWKIVHLWCFFSARKAGGPSPFVGPSGGEKKKRRTLGVCLPGAKVPACSLRLVPAVGTTRFIRLPGRRRAGPSMIGVSRWVRSARPPHWAQTANFGAFVGKFEAIGRPPGNRCPRLPKVERWRSRRLRTASNLVDHVA